MASALAALIAMTTMLTVVQGASMFRPSSLGDAPVATKELFMEPSRETQLGTQLGEPSAPMTSWLEHIIGQYKHQQAALRQKMVNEATEDFHKRFTSFGVPYFKYQAKKRGNNGIWIWMPAQGYVSVPQHHQALVAEAQDDAQGKVMRYGK